MFITLGVGIVIAMANLTLTIDVERIVVRPISTMIRLIDDLAKDPLKKGEEKNKEKTVLETAIMNIGNLMVKAFGEDGAQIIRKNMRGANGELNILRPGEKVEIIFG